MKHKAAFLDRDGTIIRNIPYLTDPAQVQFIPGGVDALRNLRGNGYLLVIVTNQSLVGRGMGTREEVEAVNRRMTELLETEGVAIDALKYCPHHPDEHCTNRKPEPGMLLEAAAELDIDLSRSIMIGDSPADVQAGERAGCPINIRIDPSGNTPGAVPDLPAAVEIVLATEP